MRALVTADVHLDFWMPRTKTHPLDALTPDEWASFDLVIVAGDLVDRGQDRWQRSLAWLGERVDIGKVHVFPGNHDLYGGTLDRDDKLRDVAIAAGAHWAQKAEIVMPGRRFLCCTLWTDMALGAHPALDAWHVERGMTDYKQIRMASNGHRRIRARDTVALHHDHRRWLEERLAAPFEGDTVVVTHHAPHPTCLGSFAGGSLGSAYASDLTALIEEHRPALWLHGHTHVASDVIVGATRFLSVAIGYPPDYERRPAGDPRAGLLEW